MKHEQAMMTVCRLAIWSASFRLMLRHRPEERTTQHFSIFSLHSLLIQTTGPSKLPARVLPQVCTVANTNKKAAYHNTNKVQLIQPAVSPCLSQTVSLVSILRVQQYLDWVISRRVRRIDASAKELKNVHYVSLD
jgi:hypothetical protein